MDRNVLCFILCFIALCLNAGIACADVFKCVDARGQASYQDTSCSSQEANMDINRDFANQLELGISADDKKTIERINNARRHIRKVMIRERNARMRAQLDRLRQKQERCRLLKADYETMHIKRRRYGRSDPDAESDLIRRMREACAG